MLNSVLEDQEQSSQQTVAHPTASSLLPPIGSTSSLSRRRSLSRRNSFGISSIPALAATQAAAQGASFISKTPLDTIQSIPETLKPNVPGATERPISRAGAISLDGPEKEEKIKVEIEPKVEPTVRLVRKKYNVPESTRSQSFVRKQVGLASVGSYNPYPDSWKEKIQSISWSRSGAIRFPESKNESSLGPGSYDAAFDYIHPRSLNVGSVAFKTQHRTFKILENPEIGPTTYSVEVIKRNHGFVPWVKQVQTCLKGIIDSKDPIPPTPHIQLISQFSSESPGIKPKSVVILIF
jgi:hypothetical protein